MAIVLKVVTNKKMNIQEKIQEKINSEASYADKEGSTSFSVCDAWYYGWDKDFWNHRHTIMDALRKRGYQVSSKTNHGVLDITVVNPLDFS